MLITICVYLTHGVKISVADCCDSNYTFLNAFSEPIIDTVIRIMLAFLWLNLWRLKGNILQLVGLPSVLYWNVTLLYLSSSLCWNSNYSPTKWYALKLVGHLEAYNLPSNYYLSTVLVTFHYWLFIHFVCVFICCYSVWHNRKPVSQTAHSLKEAINILFVLHIF